MSLIMIVGEYGPGGDPNKQLDKQSFREGEDLVNVANKYQLVTQLTDQFH